MRARRRRECCGCCWRRDQIVEAVRTRNIGGDASRFVVDPKDHIDGRRKADVAAWMSSVSIIPIPVPGGSVGDRPGRSDYPIISI